MNLRKFSSKAGVLSAATVYSGRVCASTHILTYFELRINEDAKNK